MSRRRPFSRILATLAALSSVLLVTCEKVVTGPNTGGPGGTTGSASIVIGTISAVIVGDTAFLPVSSVTVSPPVTASAASVSIVNPTYRLISSDESIIGIAAGGTSFTVKKRGTVTITAILLAATSSSGTAPQVSAKVKGIASSVVAATPTAVLGTIGDTAQLTAAAYGATVTSGDSVSNPGFTFTSGNPAIATVNAATGKLVAVANGTTTVSVSSDAATTSIAVTVKQQIGKWSTSVDTITLTAFGDTGTVVATMRDGRSVLVDPLVTNANPSWTADDTTIVRLLPAGKTVKLVALKNSSSPLVTLTASYTTTDTAVIRRLGAGAPFVRKVVAVRISQAASQVIAITPPAIALRAIGDSLVMQVRLLDRNGADLDLTKLPPNWSASNPLVASVNANGVVKAFAIGTTNIIARRDTAVRSFALTVTNDPDTVRFTNPSKDTTFTSASDSLVFVTSVRNKLGAPLVGAALTWTSLNPTIATVSASGQVKAVGQGTTTIVATATGTTVSASRLVTTTNEVTGITFASRTISMASVNDTVTPPVVIINARGAALIRSTVSWSSDNAALVFVDPTSGLIEARARTISPVFVHGVSGNARDSISVSVTNAPATIVLTATVTAFSVVPDTFNYKAEAKNARGGVLTTDLITWTSSKPSVISTITSSVIAAEARGRGTVLDTGTTIVTASVTGGGVTKTDAVTVRAVNTVTKIDLTPTGTVVLPSVGRTQRIDAFPRNTKNLIVGVTVTWTSSDPTKVTVDANGNVTGVKPGFALVTARFDIVTKTDSVLVNNAPDLVSILTPDTTITSIGDSLRTRFDFKDALGASLGDSTVTWSSSSDSGVAHVQTKPESPAGLVIARGTGTATITATSGAADNAADTRRIKSYTVLVRNDPASVKLLPGATTMTAIGKTFAFSATVKNARGAVIPNAGVTAVTWSSETPTVATIDASGIATAVAAGTSRIFVTTTGGGTARADTILLTVTNKAARHVVFPGNLSINALISTTLLDTAYNELGARIPGAPVAWVSSNSAVATVTASSGVVTGVKNGTTSIAATVDGVVVTVPVTVLAGAASPVRDTLSHSVTNVASDGVATSVVTLQLKDANGNNVTTGGDAVTMTLDPTSAVGALSSVSGGNGTFSATLTSTAPGLAIVRATVNAALINRKDTVTFVPGPASPGSSTLNVSSATGTAGGSAVTVTVQLKDAQGNNRATSGDAVGLSVAGVGNLALAGGTTNASGVFATTVSSTASGVSTISATVNTVPVTTGGRIVTWSPGAAASLALQTAPSASGASGAALATQPIVRVLDANGNVATGASGTMTATIGAGASLTSATATITAGVATFSALTATGTANPYTITFSDGTRSTPASFTLNAGAAAALAFQVAPSASAAAGATLGAQPIVKVVDGAGNTVNVTGTMTVTGGAATLAGASVSITSGVATFTVLAASGTIGGPYTLAFSDGTRSLPSSLTLTAGTAVSLAFQIAPSATAAVGVALAPQPKVNVLDASGNLATGAVGTVTATIGAGASLTSATATITGGVATFAGLTATGTANPYTLTFSDGTRSTTAGFTLTPGAAASLAFQTAPSATGASGVALASQPKVSVLDASGNVATGASGTMTATIGAGASLASATATITAGVATFSALTVTGTANPYTLSFSDGTRSTSAGFTLAAGAASKVVITTVGFPLSVANEATLSAISVQLRDANNNDVSQGGVNVIATIASGSGVLNGTTTVPTNASGVASFSALKFQGALGSYTLRFSSSLLTGATSGTVDVNAAGTPAKLVIVAQPSSAPAIGAVFVTQPRVQVSDSSGNAILAAGTTVTAARNSGNVDLLPVPSLTANTDAAGIASFAGLKLVGDLSTRTLRFTQGALSAVNSANIVPIAGAPFSAVVGQQPSAVNVAVTMAPSPTVTITDEGGNPVSGVTVTATASGGVVVSAGNTAVTNGSGVATFGALRLTGTAGSRTLTFTAGAATIGSSAFTLNVGAPSGAVVGQQPSAVAVAATMAPSPTVTITDAGGNLLSGITVTATASGGVVVSAGNTAVTNGSGVATFGALQLTGTIGSRTLTLTAGAANVVSTAFNLTVGAAASVVVGQQPADVAVDATMAPSPTVTVRDAGNNLVPAQSVSVTASNGVSVTGGSPATTNGSGVATFGGLTLNGLTGSRTLTFTAGAASVGSTAFNLTLGPPASVVVGQQPSTVAVAVTMAPSPTVTVKDGGNNPLSGVTVTATASGGVVVSAGNTAVTNGSGLATFGALQLTGTVGSRTLTFTAGAANVASNPFNLTFGAATKLGITTDPGGALANAVLSPQPVVAIQDVAGNTVTSSGATVVASLNLVAGTPLGALKPDANRTEVASGGIATFGGLKVTKVGTRTITFTSAGLPTPTVTSAVFTIGTGPQDTIYVVGPAAFTDTIGAPRTLTVLVVDAGGNPVNGATVTFNAPTGSGSRTPASANTDVNGNASTVWTLGTTPATETLKATITSGSVDTVGWTATVTAGVPVSIGITTQPSGAVNGLPLTGQPVVQLKDRLGNNVTTAGVVVTAAVTSGTPTATFNMQATTIAGGSATFAGLRLDGPAVAGYKLTFTSTTPVLTSVASNAFALGLGAAASIAITTQPSGAVNGVALTGQPVVQLRDAGGNDVTTAGVVVTAAVTTGTTTATFNMQATTIAGGSATFAGLRLDGLGVSNRKLTFTSTTPVLTSVESDAFALAVGAEASIGITTQPSGAQYGVALTGQPVVQLKDAGGNNVTTAGVVVTAAATSGTPTATFNMQATTIAGGSATFVGLRLDGPAVPGYQLTFTSTTPVLTSVASNAFTLAAGAAAAMTRILGNAQTDSAGALFTDSIKVKVADAGGNAVAGVTVDFTTLNGTASPASAVTDASGFAATKWTPGVAAGAVSLTASTAAGSAPSVGFTGTVTFANATKLLIFQQPSATASDGIAFVTPARVRISDQYGNTVTSGASSTLSIAATYTPAVASSLGGTTPLSAAAGIVTFTNLAVNLAGGVADTGFITFSTGALTVAVSTSIATSP